jgi:peptidyl-prolyl cis-trans isomerase D
MQIIQNIREKGAAVVITVIALSLIGFILMDAQQGGSRLFGSLSSNAGKVDGKTIELAEFNKKVQEAEQMEEQRSGQRPTGSRTYQMRDQVWNQMVAQVIFDRESKKLGLDQFTSKELSAILLSNDPNNPFLQEQSLKDPATGKLDLAKAQEAITNIKKMKGEQKELVNIQIIDPLSINTRVNKYSALINASVYYPTWMSKRDTENNSNFSTITYVNIPFSEISDSAVKVTDADIDAYVKKNKELYKQEAGRVISYYSFSQLPKLEDSNAVKQSAEQLKNEFIADTNAVNFLARNTSSIEFQDKYLPKSQVQSAALDSILAMSVGGVYGPYLDRGSYVLAKYLGSKSIPDSVKARHILIVTTDRNSGQAIRSDEAAQKLADSLLAAVNSGSDFGMLAMQFSADGSKDKGGDLGTFGFGAMVPEFNDFCFYKTTGERGVVKTQFGYHVIEINSQSNFNSAYKVAFFGREIFASDATINAASLAATRAAAQKDAKTLADYAAKNGLKITSVPSPLKETDYMVSGMDDARQLVKWAFESKKGQVSEPFSIGDQFIVATLDKVVEEGVQDAQTARPTVESLVRNEKKAEMIIKKLGNNPSLE